MGKITEQAIKRHREALEVLEKNQAVLEDIAALFISTLENQGKIIFMGNGGSAADAQHLAAELVGRFKKERKPLPAIALSTNTSTLTALGNDFGFEDTFLRQVEALARPGDLVVGISTSGKSGNVIRAIKKAQEIKAKTIGLLGKDGGGLAGLVDIALSISVFDTPSIQEIHI